MQILMTVINSELLEKALQNGELVFVAGRIGTIPEFQNEMVAGATACFVARRDGGLSGAAASNGFSGGNAASVRVLAKAEGASMLGGRQVSMITSGNFDLGCVKMTRPAFVVKDVRDSLKGILDITLQ